MTIPDESATLATGPQTVPLGVAAAKATPRRAPAWYRRGHFFQQAPYPACPPAGPKLVPEPGESAPQPAATGITPTGWATNAETQPINGALARLPTHSRLPASLAASIQPLSCPSAD